MNFVSINFDRFSVGSRTLADKCRMFTFRAFDDAFEFYCITFIRTQTYSDIKICVPRNIETITIMRATWANLCFAKGPLTSIPTHEHPALRIKLNLTIFVSPNGKLVIFVVLRSLNPFWFIFSHHEMKKKHCRALAVYDARILFFAWNAFQQKRRKARENDSFLEHKASGTYWIMTAANKTVEHILYIHLY